ncbi:hypothetical protein HK100_010306 [Physocladia obscura]|uniref:Uncharacterized protein n=1 Tax=Physocladia obscura TaxID=109957 RepID=A0AAD5XER9_9FUNG|nr:hypothetical protein HK100_010306 [Physocladia obscura]
MTKFNRRFTRIAPIAVGAIGNNTQRSTLLALIKQTWKMIISWVDWDHSAATQSAPGSPTYAHYPLILQQAQLQQALLAEAEAVVHAFELPVFPYSYSPAGASDDITNPTANVDLSFYDFLESSIVYGV